MYNDVESRTQKWTLFQRKEKDDKKFLIKSKSENHGILRIPSNFKHDYKTIKNHSKETKEETVTSNQKCEVDMHNNERMSLARKICFILSFNVWIVYFAVILWILPCVSRNCPGSKQWNINLSNITLTTNVVIVENMVIFGYQNETEDNLKNNGMVLALNSSDGVILWTKILDTIPLQIYCKKIPFQEFSTCIVIGSSQLLLIQLHNRKQLWNQLLVTDSINQNDTEFFICELSSELTLISSDSMTAQYMDAYQVLALNITTETLTLSQFSSPEHCKGFTKPILFNYKNATQVIVGCVTSVATEFWAISNNVICDRGYSSKYENVTIIFSITHRNKVFEDVSITDGGNNCIIFSWSNKIVCLSKNSLIEGIKIWEYSFDESVVIKNLYTGHFTSKDKNEVAVITQNENQDSWIYILNSSDGEVVMLPKVLINMKIQSSYVISGELEKDYLLINTKSSNNLRIFSIAHVLKAIDITNITKESEDDNTFYIVEFEKTAKLSKVVTTSFLDGAAVSESDNEASLITIENHSKLNVAAYMLKKKLSPDCVPS